MPRGGEGNGHVCDRRKRNESVEKGPLHARYTLNLSQPRCRRISQLTLLHVTARRLKVQSQLTPGPIAQPSRRHDMIAYLVSPGLCSRGGVET